MKNSKANNSKANSSKANNSIKRSNASEVKQHVARASKGSKAIAEHNNAAIIATASNAHKTAQPGIIAYIMQCLENAKKNSTRVSAAEIGAYLQQQFPTRPLTGMMITVRAQLSRLPAEKGFAISKQREGRIVTYCAQ